MWVVSLDGRDASPRSTAATRRDRLDPSTIASSRSGDDETVAVVEDESASTVGRITARTGAHVLAAGCPQSIVLPDACVSGLPVDPATYGWTGGICMAGASSMWPIGVCIMRSMPGFWSAMRRMCWDMALESSAPSATDGAPIAAAMPTTNITNLTLRTVSPCPVVLSVYEVYYAGLVLPGRPPRSAPPTWGIARA